ncbi:hypothetical protein ZWY2020_001249 [Hordeum vulgare]|nr:hypothetical protein ZWY2020_001249 [Hordeum vulgare]
MWLEAWLHIVGFLPSRKDRAVWVAETPLPEKKKSPADTRPPLTCTSGYASPFHRSSFTVCSILERIYLFRLHLLSSMSRLPCKFCKKQMKNYQFRWNFRHGTSRAEKQQQSGQSSSTGEEKQQHEQSSSSNISRGEARGRAPLLEAGTGVVGV